MTSLEPSNREIEFTALYERTYYPVLRYALRRTSEASAYDVTAETFVVAWRRCDAALQGDLPWLYRTAAFVLSNARRSTDRQGQVVAALSREAASQSFDPTGTYAARLAVLDALADLPRRDQELLRLIAWEDLSIRDAATALGITPTATSVRYHRAKKRLAAALGSTELPDIIPIREDVLR